MKEKLNKLKVIKSDIEKKIRQLNAEYKNLLQVENYNLNSVNFEIREIKEKMFMDYLKKLRKHPFKIKEKKYRIIPHYGFDLHLKDFVILSLYSYEKQDIIDSFVFYNAIHGDDDNPKHSLKRVISKRLIKPLKENRR